MNTTKNLSKELNRKAMMAKRLCKEYLSYVKEVDGIQNKINNMVASNVDDYDIGKQREFLEESTNVKNKVKEQFFNAKDDFIAFYNQISDEEVKESDEYLNSSTILSFIQEQNIDN
jgi:tubulin-specific chaperone A